MNRFLFFCLVLLGTSLMAQNETSNLKWLTNLEAAQKVAKEEGKPILLYFTGSDWCSPCKKLKTDFFENPLFQERAEKLVLVMIDYPRRMDILTKDQLAYNKTIIEKYNTDKSFPKIIVLNHKGKEKGRISGYSSLRDATPHFAFIDTHLE